MFDRKETRQIVSMRFFVERRSHLKSQRPRKIENRKKASRTSISSENILPKAGVIPPVHPKPSFHDHAGYRPHSEVDQEQAPAESGPPVTNILSHPLITGLHPHHKDGEPQDERDEEEARTHALVIENITSSRC